MYQVLLVERGLSSWDVRAWLLCGVWGLSSLTRDQARVSHVGSWILNPQSTNAVPAYVFLVSLWGEMSSGSSSSSTLLEKLLTVVIVSVISRGEPLRAPALPAACTLRPGASGRGHAQGCVRG